MQVVLSWKLGGRICRRVVTRMQGITTVLATYCRELDVAVAAVLLAKGVLQDVPSAADPEEIASTRDSIGEYPFAIFLILALAVRQYPIHIRHAEYQSELRTGTCVEIHR